MRFVAASRDPRPAGKLIEEFEEHVVGKSVKIVVAVRKLRESLPSPKRRDPKAARLELPLSGFA